MVNKRITKLFRQTRTAYNNKIYEKLSAHYCRMILNLHDIFVFLCLVYDGEMLITEREHLYDM